MNTADDSFLKMHRLWQAPLVQDYLHHVKRCSGFDMPPSVKALFTSYHKHFFDPPRPAFSADWGEAFPNWRWQKRHSEAVLGSVQSAVAAVYYHRDNMVRIENEILFFGKKTELLAFIGNGSIGIGNTQKLDFEYQAFVFAYRRSLDYLARAIASLLKQEFHSFRTLPKDLDPYGTQNWVRLLVAMHKKHLPRLYSFLSDGQTKSTRDLIAHYMHVPAGCLNVNAKGIFFMGGGERLSGSLTLGTVLQDNIETLEGILFEAFEAIKVGFPKNNSSTPQPI
jgi:hypothetical protein